jgi:hypothetical protein
LRVAGAAKPPTGGGGCAAPPADWKPFIAETAREMRDMVARLSK